MKAYLEINVSKKANKNSKVATSCAVQIIECFFGNVATYSGIGIIFNPTNPAGTGGSVAGAVVGALISFVTCSCNSSDCDYPKFVSTPDICYNQYNGLDFIVGGFGSSVNSILWQFQDLNGNTFYQKYTGSNALYIYNDNLQGHQTFQVAVIGYCNGGIYPPAQATIYDLNTLGKPSFFISGNTNPPVGPQQFYAISGRNLNTVTWGVGSIGQITSQNNYGIYVNWFSSGYAYLYANAQSNCGSNNSGLNVVVHN